MFIFSEVCEDVGHLLKCLGSSLIETAAFGRRKRSLTQFLNGFRVQGLKFKVFLIDYQFFVKSSTPWFLSLLKKVHDGPESRGNA